MNPRCGVPAALLVLASLAPVALALGPEDVYVLVNKNVAESQTVADYYCAKRGVPKSHVIALNLPTGEDISRADYDVKLAGPLREQLKNGRDKIKVLLTVYGVPLRVGPQRPNADEKAELEGIKKSLEPLVKMREDLEEEVKALVAKIEDDPKGRAADDLKARRKECFDLDGRIHPLQERERYLSYDESAAAVDSELALLWREGYDLRRWQSNLLYFQVSAEARRDQPPMLMTCRLDGPSVELIKQIIDRSVEVEAKGLQGKVYVDARGSRYNPADDAGCGYGGYDESMREMARLLEKDGKMSVTLDDRPELFAPDSCPDCALYCGWYSLSNYVPCCKFVPGAVAWHLASSEAVTLRDPKSKLWCKNLLENGAVATLGPVAEPYTLGFPKPEEFFGDLVTGQYTLVETYWRTEMVASWMTVLVGDPLYNPYAKAAKLKPEQVKPSPAGGRFPLVWDKNGK